MPAYKALFERIRELNVSIQIRPAVAEDAKPFTELMNRQYVRKKTEDYFYWQFINYVHPTRLFVAYDNDIFVGCYGMQVHKLSNGVLCGFSIDLLIREEYRNRALPLLFEEKAVLFARENGAEVLASLPNLNGMKAHKGLPGWSHTGTVKTYTLRGTEVLEKETGHETNDQDREFVYFSKSAEYRKWRYEMNPEYDYTYIKLNTGEFAVTKIFKDPVTGASFGDIVDFEGSLSNRDILRELFLKACGHLRNEGVEAITTWALPDTPLSNIVSSLGFAETQPERYFCFKALTPGNDRTYDFSRWHLVQADSEVY